MKLWAHRNSLLIASFVNPNSEKSAEVRSEYPIYTLVVSTKSRLANELFERIEIAGRRDAEHGHAMVGRMSLRR